MSRQSTTTTTKKKKKEEEEEEEKKKKKTIYVKLLRGLTRGESNMSKEGSNESNRGYVQLVMENQRRMR
jgi:hypothetical protein